MAEKICFYHEYEEYGCFSNCLQCEGLYLINNIFDDYCEVAI